MLPYIKLHRYSILITLGCVLFYLSFAYDLNRENFTKLIVLYAGLVYFHYKLIQFEKLNFKFLLVAGILFRLVFLIAEPNLSQDFYRFIWDGELINQGINPYLFTPDQLISDSSFYIRNSSILYEGMGALSAENFSNYPPLNQLLFAISTFLGGGSILGSLIVMRLLIILADIGMLHFSRKLLQNLGSSKHLAFWYFLSPLVLIELTGNLHFEGVMLFFFVWAIYLISINKWKYGAIVFSLSILTKLIPAMFLPFFLSYMGYKKSAIFYAIILFTCFLFVLPFYSTFLIGNYLETLNLYFKKFEFNASTYNIVEHITPWFFNKIKPWDVIKIYGQIMPITFFLVAMFLAFYKKNENLQDIFKAILILITTYFILSTTVHPWYIITILAISIFTNYKYPILWTILIVVSYSAYKPEEFKENLLLISLEYLILFSFITYEIVTKTYLKKSVK